MTRRQRRETGAIRIPGRGALPSLVLGLALALVLALGVPGCAGKGPRGVIHHVAAGENLYRIGLRYGVDARAIARANGIRDVTTLRVGQRLYIPDARHRLAAPQGERRPRSADLDTARERARERARRPEPGTAFRWPLRGRLSSGFGGRRGRPHEGIDIAAPQGTPIRAAAPGRVLFSGRMRGYGRVVIVKHAGHYRTVYAHASRLLVRRGEFVEPGQPIAEVGSSGRSSGPHLHFEVRRGETPQNPLAYLR